jgi:hypothetical protein
LEFEVQPPQVAFVQVVVFERDLGLRNDLSV